MATVKNLDQEKYHHIALVADALDLQVHSEVSTTAMPEFEVVFSIGTKGDLDVGLFPVTVTPLFPSLDQLESFCTEHKDAYIEMANAEELPEKFFWEEQQTIMGMRRVIDTAINQIDLRTSQIRAAQDRFRDNGFSDKAAGCGRAIAELQPIKAILQGKRV